MFDWDDMRFFIAVARGGSTAAGARALGVDQTTVARRIAALEQVLGGPLFERRPGGYRLTEPGREALVQAERVEAEAKAFLDLNLGRRRKVEGTVRVTGTETMVTHLLGPAVFAMRSEHPGLKVEIVVDDRRLDLVRGEADVALRVGSTPQEPSLVRRRMPDSCWTVYCSRAYEHVHGRPTSAEDLERHLVVAGEGPMVGMAALTWLASAAPRAEVVCRCNTVPNLVSMVRAGVGVSTLPCIVGESLDDLVRCLPPPAALRGELWLVHHESQQRAPHIRNFVDSLAGYVKAQRHLLSPAA